jgi:uncharacterized protein YdeI (YjbR/CyaY-like superfamily)
MPKSKLNPQVDLYLVDGCGRCKFYATPKCKVRKWTSELEYLRQIALESGLTEEIKWGVPVYTLDNKNVINISAFKDYSCISFFKGVLLKDSKKLLQKHGENSQSVRTLNFTDTETIVKLSSVIKAYIQEAIELEKKGEKVEFKKNLEPVAEELETKFKESPALKKAFYALTPGRQRGYIIFFSSAKQTETRTSRIEKYTKQILAGKGMQN